MDDDDAALAGKGAAGGQLLDGRGARRLAAVRAAAFSDGVREIAATTGYPDDDLAQAIVIAEAAEQGRVPIPWGSCA